MAKSTSIKDAVANFEKAKSVVAAEAEKVTTLPPLHGKANQLIGQQLPESPTRRQALVCHEQVELWGQCPPIDKMDGVLASLKACKWVISLSQVLAMHPCCLKQDMNGQEHLVLTSMKLAWCRCTNDHEHSS